MEFATRIGCDAAGSSGDEPRGIPFRLRGRGEDLFAFWVERLADRKKGLAAISFDPKRLSEELRPAFSALIVELRRTTGEAPVKTKRYYSAAVGFTTVEDGLKVLARIDGFVSEAVARLGLGAFAPYVPERKPSKAEHAGSGNESSVANWSAEETPPGVDPEAWAQILRRRGQRDFREQLLQAYGRKCAITGCEVVAALEAAHITPYSEVRTHGVSNGLLLRADIHTLFDLYLITVDPSTLCVRVAPSLRADYGEWEGSLLSVPGARRSRPSLERIADHYERWSRLLASSCLPERAGRKHRPDAAAVHESDEASASPLGSEKPS